MNLSRSQKNLILTLALWAWVVVKVVLFTIGQEQPRTFDWIFMGMVLIVTLLNYSPLKSFLSPKWRHSALFLTAGTGIGSVLGAALRNPQSIHFLEWGWIVLGLTAAIVHYSHSNRDQYMK